MKVEIVETAITQGLYLDGALSAEGNPLTVDQVLRALKIPFVPYTLRNTVYDRLPRNIEAVNMEGQRR